MAAPSGTVWGSIVNGTSSGRKGRLGIYVNTSSTATETTVQVEVWFWTIYSCSDTGNTFYYNAGKGVTAATTSYGSCKISHTQASGSGWSTSNQTRLHKAEYTYARTTSKVTHNVYAKFSGIDILNGTVHASTTYTIPALASYTVKYNANGGSGAPSSQTKWYGKDLTLSSTKPTRAGYTFKGWLDRDADATLYAGGVYTPNASVTLYAIWEANTYTVKYNANGGSGAPSSQTKTYGVALTLSSTKPTRSNYTFKGWGTSAKATTVAYAAGDPYTANAAVTLYAIWTLSYKKPRITNFSVGRCASDGSDDDAGTYALVKFNWVCDKTVSSIKIEWKLSSGSSWSSTTVSASGTSGSVSKVIGAAALSTDNTYDVKVTVTDSTDYSDETGTLGGTKFPIDVKGDGTGVSFGKPAELSGYMDVGYKSRFRDNVVLDNAKAIYSRTSAGSTISLLYAGTSDTTVLGYGGYTNNIGSTGIYGASINLYSKGDISTSAPLHLTRTTNASATADNNPALTIGPSTGVHVEFDNNEIMAKTTATTAGSLYINRGGGNVLLNNNKINDTYVRGCKIAVNTVLWSGTYYMNEGQTVPLDETPISAQANGIVLIWSEYSDGAAVNANFNTFFIPKHFVTVQNDRGIAMGLWTATANTFASKYVYVKDTELKGYVNNAIDPWVTSCGITSSPKRFVLRYVIGV